jgi:hypothetical protein
MSDAKYSPYWETDEFEDLVARSLIGLYETKVKEEKKGPKSSRFDKELFDRVKRFGCFFPANNRVVMLQFDENNKASFVQSIDMLNDGLPDKAIITQTNDEMIEEYLWSFFIERVPFLPAPYTSKLKGKTYRVNQIYFGNQHVSGCGTYVRINSSGAIASCYIPGQFKDPITKRNIAFENRPHMDEPMEGALDFYSTWTSVTIQSYQDRLHLWNVQAKEGIANATFSVYPEQIQSLFYARDLPVAATGRKRPILHWVNAHNRRMKSGVEVDIDQYLRGQNEFVMNGTKFIITNPSKVKDA